MPHRLTHGHTELGHKICIERPSAFHQLRGVHHHRIQFFNTWISTVTRHELVNEVIHHFSTVERCNFVGQLGSFSLNIICLSCFALLQKNLKGGRQVNKACMPYLKELRPHSVIFTERVVLVFPSCFVILSCHACQLVE
ncbi:hypothetical protein SAMN03084138_02023 [Enterovibrio norvegicus DSM 15893]|uniref:Uncharacterized protein n=1 Tax=Enterovibrio norvegicus DSM 15893 TaxID=1121869 RepID=A0A1I5PSL4_9GAMM|nr:hypothetical protein SAMN03084138_02023 [Enterovibrio norvegicus DSM 15893]